MKPKTHKKAVYFVPGMAANSQIFEYIKLPEAEYNCFYLEWKIPLEGESLQAYAKRMCTEIKHENPILIGVSFGGIVVQEMNRFINVHKTVVISSVLHQNDFPLRMKFAKRTKIYKLLPTRILSDVDKMAKYAFGETIKSRVRLYKKYLSMSDGYYLKWALQEIINWQQTQQLANIIHIHGSEDQIFPKQYIKDDFVEVKKGTHVMIVFKHKWFNENLPKLLTA